MLKTRETIKLNHSLIPKAIFLRVLTIWVTVIRYDGLPFSSTILPNRQIIMCFNQIHQINGRSLGRLNAFLELLARRKQFTRECGFDLFYQGFGGDRGDGGVRHWSWVRVRIRHFFIANPTWLSNLNLVPK